MRRLSLLAICVLVIGACGNSHAAMPAYIVHDLGTFVPRAINVSGQIVGSQYQPSSGETHAILRNLDGSLVHLSMFSGGVWAEAWDINDSGQAVGWAKDSAGINHAVLWNPDGSMTDIGWLSGGSFGSATAINNAGQVTGSSRVGAYDRAFLWSASGGFVDLSALGSGVLSGIWAYGWSINAQGYVTGYGSVRKGAVDISHAILWKPDGTVQDLGASISNASFGRAVNNSVQVAVNVSLANDFLWTSTGVTTLTGFDVYGMNNRGEIVGVNTSDRAGFWSASTGLVSLPSIAAWNGSSATDINYARWIIGTSYQTWSYDRRGVLWEAVPEPSSFLALVCGLAGLGILRRRVK